MSESTASTADRPATGRVVVDIDGMAVLVADMHRIRDTLGAAYRDAGVAVDTLAFDAPGIRELADAGAWADDAARMLERRRSLAADADGAARLTGTPTAGVHRDGTGRVVLAGTGPAEAYRSRGDAYAAGVALAGRLLDPGGRAPDGPGPGGRARLDGGRALDGEMALLARHAGDPDFTAGLFDRLGPAGLADVIYAVEGMTTSVRAPAGRRPAVSDVGAAEVALGTALATYSRNNRLDDTWLGRLNAYGTDGEFESSLLVPLLPAGRFDPGLLARLGDALFGAGIGPKDAGSLAAGRLPDRLASPAAYRAALLRAIADTPTLAASFAQRHIEKILFASHLHHLGLGASSVVPLPALEPTPDEAELARAYLVARAGGTAARRVDPRAAETFVAHLAFVVHAEPGRHVSLDMQAAFGDVLHTYARDMYGAVMSVVPQTAALLDGAGDRPIADWPGAGAVFSPANSETPGVELPEALWAALLRESLCGGASAGRLAADATTVARDVEAAGWAATRAYTPATPAFPGHLPSSPRGLSLFQAAQAERFFAAGMRGAADMLADDLDHADEARRAQVIAVVDVLGGVASSIDPLAPGRSLVGMTIGATVEAVKADAKARHGRPTSAGPALDRIRALGRGAGLPTGWQIAYQRSVNLLWQRRSSEPLMPVRVTVDDTGGTRLYTGDPHGDGFVRSPADDFLGADGMPIDPRRMTAAQRDAYVRWATSPAVVANLHGLPTAAAGLPPGNPPGNPPDDPTGGTRG